VPFYHVYHKQQKGSLFVPRIIERRFKVEVAWSQMAERPKLRTLAMRIDPDSKYGTYKTVKARFWPWLSDRSDQNL